jgi:hypothetical protein
MRNAAKTGRGSFVNVFTTSDGDYFTTDTYRIHCWSSDKPPTLSVDSLRKKGFQPQVLTDDNADYLADMIAKLRSFLAINREYERKVKVTAEEITNGEVRSGQETPYFYLGNPKTATRVNADFLREALIATGGDVVLVSKSRFDPIRVVGALGWALISPMRPL